MDAKAQIEALRSRLNEHSYLYYVLAQPTLTDAEYDALFRELQQLERLHPELDDLNSPTKRVGAPVVGGFKKAKHERKMLSLDNTYNAGEVAKFFGNDAPELVLEPKIDGTSLKLIYRKGRLFQAVTRGNGMEGDDVTANARAIGAIPLLLQEPLDIEVTGEVYMTYTAFEALNVNLAAVGEDLMANPRNAASGTLKLLNPSVVAQRRLSFAAHGSPTELPGVQKHTHLIGLLGRLGFQTVVSLPRRSVSPVVFSTMSGFINVAALEQEIADADKRRSHLDLATDGLVFKINELAKQRELGEGTRSPNWAVAFKYPPERKVTTLLGITLQVGRTGKITPVAELKDVALSGTVVRRASLCNQNEVERLGINVGDDVYVEKSAEIIPKVMGLAAKRADGVYAMPKVCPCCGKLLVRPEGLVDFYCENADCDDQVYARLLHATGKAALDIDGCGDMMVRELIAQGVRSLSGLFEAANLKFKPAAYKRFSAGREKAKAAPLWRKYHALGIEGIGSSLCQDIASRWTSLLRDIVFAETYPPETQKAIEELRTLVGPVNFDSIIEYLADNADEIIRLDELGFKLETEASQLGPLSGKVFVITGALMSGTRDEVMRRIEKAGGMVKSSVSAKVHYLVEGAEGGATKAAAAERHNVSRITEEALYEMMGVAMPAPGSSVNADREY